MEQENTQRTLGTHVLAEFYACSEGKVNDPDFLQRVMEQAVEVAGATLVRSHFHTFSPVGVSGVVVIKESHFAVHTWPEHRYAAIDLFTCSADMDHEAALKFLAEALESEYHEQQLILRGNLDRSQAPFPTQTPKPS